MPCCGHRAIDAGLFQLVQRRANIFPGGKICIGVDSGLFQHVAVDPKDRRGRVEGQRQHVTIGRCVIAFDRPDIFRLVKLGTGIFHDLIDWLYRTLGTHHRGRANLEHHQDVGLLACAKCRDTRVQRFGIVALVAGDDRVVILAGIEGLYLFGDQFTQTSGKRMPELDFRLRKGGLRRAQNRSTRDKRC